MERNEDVILEVKKGKEKDHRRGINVSLISSTKTLKF